MNTCNYSDYSTCSEAKLLVIPVSFMETTRLLATRAARHGLCSHACVLRRGEPRTGLCVPRRCQIGPWGSPTAPCARVERPN